MGRPLCAAVLIGTALLGASSYRERVQAWRDEREAKLQAEDGWLAVAGLFWLKEGPNRFGSDPGNAIVLPSGPARAGVFELHAGRVNARLFDYPGSERELRPEPPGPEDPIRIGDLTLHLIRRGERFGIRLRDKNGRARREFAGRRWFPVREEHRITARFVENSAPRNVAIPNVLGDVMQVPSPGYAVFTLVGREFRLEPIVDEGELFFIFRDLTAGQQTYPAGRFLCTEVAKGGRVVLDFNKAENPPCAFTPYATCPLPPKQNHLAVRIEAGELYTPH